MSAPGERRLWVPFDEAARRGELMLQVCADCNAVQYPAREVCRRCLSGELKWEAVDPAGKLLSHTLVHVSNEETFRKRLPLSIGSVKLDCGPVVLAFLQQGAQKTGTRVAVKVETDESGRGILIARTGDQ